MKIQQQCTETAVAYITAMGNKDIGGIGACLHPDVHFLSPMTEITGKTAVLEGVKTFLPIFQKLQLRVKGSVGDQAMLVYDLIFPAPIGRLRVAALLTVCDDLITDIELFFDGRQMERR